MCIPSSPLSPGGTGGSIGGRRRVNPEKGGNGRQKMPRMPAQPWRSDARQLPLPDVGSPVGFQVCWGPACGQVRGTRGCGEEWGHAGSDRWGELVCGDRV